MLTIFLTIPPLTTAAKNPHNSNRKNYKNGLRVVGVSQNKSFKTGGDVLVDREKEARVLREVVLGGAKGVEGKHAKSHTESHLDKGAYV